MSPKFKKILLYTGSAIGIIILILLVAAFTVSTEFSVERSIEIEKPKDDVFEYVRFLENQYNYSVWGSVDPNMQREFRGTDGAVGFVSAWEGNEEAGAGEQEIIGMSEGERIDYELRFFEPFESTSYAYMSTEALSDSLTQVSWGMYGTFPRPLNLMLLFFDLENAIGDDYQAGLNNLKVLLEEARDE